MQRSLRQKSIRFFTGLAIAAPWLALAMAPGVEAADKADTPTAVHPVLLELFTSQGCSSCPPADALAQELSSRDDLVVISRPVTYWDRLGWKDTLAREENTQLQRRYAARGLAGRNGVYTPQIVVDGNRGAVGSDRNRIEALVRAERGASAAVASRLQPSGSHVIGLGGATESPSELVLVAIKSRAVVRIIRGENRNREIGYTNVVVGETRLAEWEGGKQALVLSDAQLSDPNADRYALILREKNAGSVLAARFLPRG